MPSRKRALSLILLATSALLLVDDESTKEPPKKKVKRSVWVRKWIEDRPSEGCFAKLLPELRFHHPKDFTNFLRMSANDFDYLLDLVSPLITKKDTKMRKAIPPGERLALALRYLDYLATGDSFKSLEYLFRIPQSTISTIMPAVLDAIYAVLKENYLKVGYVFQECIFFHFFLYIIPRVKLSLQRV